MGIFSGMIDAIKNNFSASKKEDIHTVDIDPKALEAKKPKNEVANNYQHLEDKLQKMSDSQYESVIQSGRKLLNVMNSSQKPAQKSSSNNSLRK